MSDASPIRRCSPTACFRSRPRPGEAFIENENGEGQLVPFVAPRALQIEEMPYIVRQYARGSRNALEAGFDGVEVHAANGYLLDQFINSSTNRRADGYGGAIENRARLLVEVIEAVEACRKCRCLLQQTRHG
jgi:N-ethylmaleimide reductase